MLSLTELFHSSFGEVNAIISYDAVWKTKAEDHLFDELNRHGRITLTDWLCLYTLGELINCHQKVGLLILGPLERPNHIQPPSCKRPGDWNHPQFLS